MGAAFFAIPEIAIDETEARALADATAEVAKHYDFLPDPKTQAWLNLAIIAGGIYGMRFWVIWNKPVQPAQPAPSIVPGTAAPTDNIQQWPGMAPGAGRA